MPTNSQNTIRQLQALGITVLFVAYWLFVHSLANIDASQSFVMQFWTPFPEAFPGLATWTPVITFFVELFSWRVLRHFIPVILALWLARRTTIGLMQLLLSLPDEVMATNYLTRLQRAGTIHTPPVSGPPSPATPTTPARSSWGVLFQAAAISFVIVFLLAFFLLLQGFVGSSLGQVIPIQSLISANGFLVWVTIWLIATGLLYAVLNQPTQGLEGVGIQVRRTQFEEDRRDNPWLRIGGPGRFRVDNNDVIVTERNGRFWRVAGPGSHWLAPFETIRAVLDLRQQERDNPLVHLMTKDGIQMRTQVHATYRLARGDNLPSDGWPFPFDHESVRRAAYLERILPDGSVGNWEGVALGSVVGQLRKQVAQSELDELVYPEVAFPGRRGSNPHQTLKEIMLRDGRTDLATKGIELLAVQLGVLEPSLPIQDQRVKYWQAFWEKQHRIDMASSSAEAMRILDFARAEGEAAIIEAIMESFQQARLMGQEKTPREIMALRLIESLERLAENAKSSEAEPELIRQLGQIRNQLNAYGDADTDETAAAR